MEEIVFVELDPDARCVKLHLKDKPLKMDGRNQTIRFLKPNNKQGF